MEDGTMEPESVSVTYPLHVLNFDKDAFTAEIVNAVIEISMNRFTEIDTHATRMLKLTSKELHEALEEGLSIVFEKFLTKFLEEDLAPWETYCKEACLSPSGSRLAREVRRVLERMRR